MTTSTLQLEGNCQKKALGRMGDASFCSTATTGTATLQCVAFDLEPQIMEVSALSDMSLEERQATWYSPDEKESMIEQAMSIANDVFHGIFYGNEDEDSVRGLEFYSLEGSRRRKLNRIKATIAVLREQQRQQEQEASAEASVERGDELIEAACLEATRPCQEQAYIQGCLDEEEVFPQKPRITKVEATKTRGMFSCFTQLVKDITDIGYVEWAAQ